MIASREDLLSAIRRAVITPQGLVIGPVAFVDGHDILFGKITTEEARRALLMKVKLAGSKCFGNVRWEMPCSEKIQYANQSGYSLKEKTTPFDGVPF